MDSTSERASVDFFSPVNEWHGFQPICIANNPSTVRCLQRTSDCYEVNRVSVAPRGADVVGSLKLVQRGNGDMGATRKTTRPVDEL